MTNPDIIASFLDAESTLYTCFAPINTIKLTKSDEIIKFYKDCNSNFDYTKTELEKSRAFYFGITGYTQLVDLYWFLAEISIAMKDELIKTNSLIYFSQDSLMIDGILMDMFDLFPSTRYSVAIVEPRGKLQSLISDASIWFKDLLPVYLQECKIMLKTVRGRKKK